MVRTLFTSTVLLLAAGSAGAQITTYIAPPRPAAELRMIAAADSAQRDSVAVASMTNMKAWVDSAAGIPVPATVGRIDSAALVNDPGRPVTVFSDGSVAPATASALPAIAIFGVLALGTGLLLLGSRPRG